VNARFARYILGVIDQAVRSRLYFIGAFPPGADRTA